LPSREVETANSLDAREALIEYLSCDERLGTPSKTFNPEILHRVSTRREFVTVVKKERLANFVSSSSSFHLLPTDLASQIVELSLEQARAALVIAKDLIEISINLQRLGIRHAFFKGLALAELSQGNFASRGGGDIDVLVEPGDVVALHELLTVRGARAGFQIVPASTLGFSFFEWLTKELPYRLGFVDLDLHWRLVSATGITPRADTLLERACSLDLCGNKVTTLSEGDSLALAALTYYFDGNRKLRQLVDFQLLATRIKAIEPEYSRAVHHLVDALRGHAATVFGLVSQSGGHSAKHRRLSRIIFSDWRSSTNRRRDLAILRFKVADLSKNLAKQTSLGGRIRNTSRFLASIAFDFRGSDFASDTWILVKAMKLKVSALVKRVLRHR
jgi:hypothetical protein